MSSALSSAAMSMLTNSNLSAADQSSLAASAEGSPYFADLMNKFAESGGQISVGGNTEYNKGSNTININPDLVPSGPIETREPYGKFASTVAHELGHAVQPGGVGGEALTADQASSRGRMNEGVAISTEYIVAKQLGEPEMHTRDVQSKLDQIAAQSGLG